MLCIAALVNILPGAPAVLVVALSCSPGLPEMNPSMFCVSPSVHADREHDQVQSGPWLEGLSRESQRLNLLLLPQAAA